jgi:hypothetical protein
VLKSVEELRSRQGNEIPDQIADSVAGQSILVDLRISELLDTAAKLFDRAFRNPAAMAEEGAQLAQALQKIANGNSTWAPPRNDKRFNDPAWTEYTYVFGSISSPNTFRPTFSPARIVVPDPTKGSMLETRLRALGNRYRQLVREVAIFPELVKLVVYACAKAFEDKHPLYSQP